MNTGRKLGAGGAPSRPPRNHTRRVALSASISPCLVTPCHAIHVSRLAHRVRRRRCSAAGTLGAAPAPECSRWPASTDPPAIWCSPSIPTRLRGRPPRLPTPAEPELERARRFARKARERVGPVVFETPVEQEAAAQK